MSWTLGYVTEVNYLHAYHRELNPALLRLACIAAGFVPPPAGPLNYLELGFGQGLSINIHAAAFAGAYWGNDFNPAQAAHARALAQASGSGAKLVDDSFVEFAARSDLPEFDVIALHGVWTWISADNRRAIVDLIRRKLRVGGLVYVSYNCFPGWGAVVPLRHLLTLHAELTGPETKGIAGKVGDALGFAQRLANMDAIYFKANPAVADTLSKALGKDRAYLAHEYFNRDWDVMAFSDVANLLAEAKLNFAGSANLAEQVDALNLTLEWQTLLAEIDHPVLRQSVRDFLVNQKFRRDIFVKGLRPLSGFERMEALKTQPFVATSFPTFPIKVAGSVGQIPLEELVYRPLLEALADDAYTPKTPAALAANPKLKGMKADDIAAMLLLLTATGDVHPAQPVTREAAARCDALNQHLCASSRSRPDINHLASAVTGTGVPVNRFQQLFLLAAHQGKTTTGEQAAFVWELLSAQGQTLVKDGKPLENANESIAELAQHAEEFAATRLPFLKALGVA